MKIPRGYCLDSAHRHLHAVDPELKRWIRRIGRVDADPRWAQRFDLVDALARAILFQQLSGKAAATIVGRVERASGGRVLRAERIAALSDETLRGCGVSGNKARALRDLCARSMGGELPRTAELNRLGEDAIVERLTAVRGIGRWTVEMLLMFRLGRPDVCPVDDLGIRKGLARLRGLDGMPTPRQTLEMAEPWMPYRSLACVYLWRIADAD